MVAPVPADDAALTRVHDPAYLAAVAGRAGRPALRWLGPGHGATTRSSTRMHEASALVAGATLRGGRGGLARRGAARGERGRRAAPRDAAPGPPGFCVYNDPAVAIARLLDLGAERIAYVDVDVHHGDGVQAIFWDDPRVLTVSLHETPLTLFPGTGFPHETGGPGAGAAPSTWRCRPAPTTAAGCGPSTPWCRRCCARSVRRCCSPSAARTPTSSTRWPTCA